MEPLKVTFDSNVWRIVVSPGNFPNNDDHEHCRQIGEAIKANRACGFLSESIFTLEAVRRKGRQEFLANYRMDSNVSVEQLEDGSLKLAFSIGPDKKNQPVDTPYLDQHWKDAHRLGFRIMRIPRLGGVVNPDLEDDWFVNIADVETMSAIGADIEKRGCGIAALKAIGDKYSSPDDGWMEGMRKAPSSEEGAIANAMAEWADGDSVCLHYGFANDYFCTKDKAKSAGPTSVLSDENKKWLGEEYGVQFVAPEELAKILNSNSR